MDITSLRGMSRADQFREAAKFAGVSPSVFAGIYRTESSNGVNMTSPKGARGGFGIMPHTQAAWEQRSGLKLDPNDFTDGLYISANQLKENMGSTGGDVEDALRMYNAGPKRERWNNTETQEYVGKVLGRTADITAERTAQGAAIKGKVLTLQDLSNMSEADFMSTAPTDMEKAASRGEHPGKLPSVADLTHQALGPVAPSANSDLSLRPESDAIRDERAPELAHQRFADSLGFKDKMDASLLDNTLTASIIRGFTREKTHEDPTWTDYYVKNRADMEGTATNQDEVNWLRESTSAPDYWRIRREMQEKHDRQAIYGANGGASSVLWSLGAGAADPAGWAAGFGVGKALEVAGVGSRAFLAGRAAQEATEAVEVPVIFKNKLEFNQTTGKFEPPQAYHPNPIAGVVDPATGIAAPDFLPETRIIPGTKAVSAIQKNVPLGLASLAAENVTGNVLTTAAIDASGEHVSTEDYAYAAGAGLLISALAAPFHIRGKADTGLADFARKLQVDSAEKQADRLRAAQAELGPDADKEAIMGKVQEYERNDVVDTVRRSLAEVPDSQRFLPEETSNLLTSDHAVKEDVHSRYDLAAISDDAERDMVAETIAQSERIIKENPLSDKGLKTILQKATVGSVEGQGMESTGLTLLNSKSPTARAVSMMLLEGTTGAGGRRRTAALSQVMRERLYNQATHGVEPIYQQWRRANGYHIITEAVNGKGFQEFNRRIFNAIEERGRGTAMEQDPLILQAADKYSQGFDLMRTEQQHVGTAGAARLGDTSEGYVPHRLDARKVLGLSNEQNQILRGILSDQFVDKQNGFDRKFSDTLAAKYLEIARGKAQGGYDVPMNLHDAEAADIVNDALRALTPDAANRVDLMGKFSRGGATHTKKRLRLDLSTPIPDADGVVRNSTLGNLFVQDMNSLYRGQARRVSGEVALAQYGIVGKKGLNILRTSMQRDGATPAELKAFDQIASEFLNTPFGEHNHKLMDNMRLASTVSRLGGMGFTQFAEYGNAIAALGVHGTFAAIKDLPRILKEVGQIKATGHAKNGLLESLETLGGHFGMDDYEMTRLFDVKDNDIKLYGTENLSVMDRALRAGAHANSVLSMHRAILAVQTRGMAEQIIRKAVKYSLDGRMSVHLDDMGINAELRKAIRADLPHIAEFDGNTLTKLDFAKSKMDPGQIMELRQAIERGASQIIQRTYIGETGRWAHDGLLKLLFQFRTFGITSVEKQWGRNVANVGNIKAAGYLLGAMSFALPIQMARVHMKMAGMPRAQRDKYAQANLGPMQLGRSTLNYASASGLLGDILDIGAGFASAWGGDAGQSYAETVGARGAARQNLLGGVLGPSIGEAEDLWSGIHGHNPHKIISALPGSNLPLVQPLLNIVAPDKTP